MSADKSTNEPDYKATLSLPDTSFPMRGDLVKNEPKRLERWNQENLYQRIPVSYTHLTLPTIYSV